MLQIAVDKDWVLSAHTDQKTIETMFRLQPTLKIIWAHCGFDVPADSMRRLMATYPGLYCEMSFYDKMFDSDLKLLPEWKTLMEDLSDRFMVGTDPYTEGRWAGLSEETGFIQAWLKQLSADAAAQIANGNISRLFP